MREYQFSLNISADDYIYYYRGRVSKVSVLAWDGTRIEFHAERLRSFVTSSGIQGQFILSTDDQHRFISLVKVK